MHVLLQYQSKSYYIIGQEVYYSIGRFITLSGSYYIIGRFLLHYRAVITVSGVYYIIGWYSAASATKGRRDLRRDLGGSSRILTVKYIV